MEHVEMMLVRFFSSDLLSINQFFRGRTFLMFGLKHTRHIQTSTLLIVGNISTNAREDVLNQCPVRGGVLGGVYSSVSAGCFTWAWYFSRYRRYLLRRRLFIQGSDFWTR